MNDNITRTENSLGLEASFGTNYVGADSHIWVTIKQNHQNRLDFRYIVKVPLHPF